MDRPSAIKFLENRLQIQNVSNKLEKGRLDLLNNISEQWLKILPFQNISQMCRDRQDRAIQSVEQSLQDITSGLGGMCWAHNVALFYILKSLGFDTYLAISAVMSIDELNHAAPVIKNVEQPGDAYLMDVGTGYPCFTAVSLHFQHESPVFKQSFTAFKFEKVDDYIRCFHLTTKGKDKTGRPFPKFDNEGWAEYYRLWLKECDIDYIKEQLDKNVYSNLDFRFNNCLRVVKFPNLKLKALKDDVLLIEDEDGQIKERKLRNIEEMKAVVVEHFPEIPMELLTKALGQWHKKC